MTITYTQEELAYMRKALVRYIKKKKEQARSLERLVGNTDPSDPVLQIRQGMLDRRQHDIDTAGRMLSELPELIFPERP